MISRKNEKKNEKKTEHVGAVSVQLPLLLYVEINIALQKPCAQLIQRELYSVLVSLL